MYCVHDVCARACTCVCMCAHACRCVCLMRQTNAYSLYYYDIICMIYTSIAIKLARFRHADLSIIDTSFVALSFYAYYHYLLLSLHLATSNVSIFTLLNSLSHRISQLSRPPSCWRQTCAWRHNKRADRHRTKINLMPMCLLVCRYLSVGLY